MNSTYELLVLVHVLAFVYWLGADLGVLYAAKYGADKELSLQTRQTIGEVMAFVDLFPRLSVPIIGATGITMAFIAQAFEMSKLALGLTWLAAFLWVGSNVFIHLYRAYPDRTGSARIFDTLLRIIVLVTTGVIAIVSLLGIGISTNKALAMKLLIFSIAVALSLVLRILFKPYRPALKRIAAGGDNLEDSEIMKRALSRARPVILAIWLLTVVAAAIGLWKPY